MSIIIPKSGRTSSGVAVISETDLEGVLSTIATQDLGTLKATSRAAFSNQVVPVSRSIAEWTGDSINLKGYAPLVGSPAVGDNITDDTSAISAVITEANARYLATGGAFPTSIVVPPGQYRITAPLPAILGSTRVFAPGGSRSASFNFNAGLSGSDYDGMTFRGITAPIPARSCSVAGVDGLGFGSYGMTGGNQLVFDWCTDVFVQNVLSTTSYNFCSLRQVNLITFQNVFADHITGAYGIKAYGAETSRTGTTRNGAPDWVSLLNLFNVTMVGNNNPGVMVGTPDLLWLDGSVQTVNFNTLILLEGHRGWYSSNTPNVPNPLFSSFLWGQNLQVETPYAEAIRFECVNQAEMSGVYAVGAQTASGIYLGSNANEVSMRGGRVQQNYAHGVMLDGAQQVGLSELSIWGNSQGGSGIADGIHIQNGADRVRIVGGLSGRRVNNPVVLGGSTQYTELQAFGIHNDGGGSRITAIGTDLIGNVGGTTSGPVTLTACLTV